MIAKFSPLTPLSRLIQAPTLVLLREALGLFLQLAILVCLGHVLFMTWSGVLKRYEILSPLWNKDNLVVHRRRITFKIFKSHGISVGVLSCKSAGIMLSRPENFKGWKLLIAHCMWFCVTTISEMCGCRSLRINFTTVWEVFPSIAFSPLE